MLAGTLVLAAARPARAEEPPDREIAGLIGALGAGSFRVRDGATRRLWEIGQPAAAALQRAAASENLEVRTRAQMILAYLRLGIEADWPAGLADRARKLESCSDAERKAILDAVCEALGGRALPFLLAQLAIGDDKAKADALARVKALAAADRAVWGRIIGLLREPENACQGQALILARVNTGCTIEAMKLLSRFDVGSSQRAKILSDGVAGLLDLLKQFRFDEALSQAGEYAEAAPTEARFLYLQAEALAALEQDDKAEALRAKALGVHPSSEAPHYTAAEMLQHKLGRRRLAEKEWRKILAIPPSDDVYDMNALVRLQAIYAQCGLYAQAADCLEQAVAMIQQARSRGGGVGIVGGDIDTMRKHVRHLRETAARRGHARPEVRDVRPDHVIGLNVGAAVKDGKLKEMREALRQAAATVRIDIQPRGLRLFDRKLLVVRYDAAKGRLGVYLHGSACSEPAALRLSGKTARIAVLSLDCCYVYEVDVAGGSASQVARYEKDYTLRLAPGNKIAACRNLRVTVNGKGWAWKDVLAGVQMDYLPEKFDVAIEGTRPCGKPLKLKLTTAANDPDG